MVGVEAKDAEVKVRLSFPLADLPSPPAPGPPSLKALGKAPYALRRQPVNCTQSSRLPTLIPISAQPKGNTDLSQKAAESNGEYTEGSFREREDPPHAYGKTC